MDAFHKVKNADLMRFLEAMVYKLRIDNIVQLVISNELVHIVQEELFRCTGFMDSNSSIRSKLIRT